MMKLRLSSRKSMKYSVCPLSIFFYMWKKNKRAGDTLTRRACFFFFCTPSKNNVLRGHESPDAPKKVSFSIRFAKSALRANANVSALCS